MFVNGYVVFLISSPFYQAFEFSDYLGKSIFLLLLISSICIWSIFIRKLWMSRKAKRDSYAFRQFFQKQKHNLLQLEWKADRFNPFYDLFLDLKKQVVDLLNKNHHFQKEGKNGSFLSASDIDCLGGQLISRIANETQELERNVFILSTLAGLSPLLGLLGTVWGILTTFSAMQTPGMGVSNQAVLSGISLALTTTVLGLINAIPALITYNYLKNDIERFAVEMEGFANEILTSVELQYRKVEF